MAPVWLALSSGQRRTVARVAPVWLALSPGQRRGRRLDGEGMLPGTIRSFGRWQGVSRPGSRQPVPDSSPMGGDCPLGPSGPSGPVRSGPRRGPQPSAGRMTGGAAWGIMGMSPGVAPARVARRSCPSAPPGAPRRSRGGGGRHRGTPWSSTPDRISPVAWRRTGHWACDALHFQRGGGNRPFCRRVSIWSMMRFISRMEERKGALVVMSTPVSLSRSTG